MRTSLDGALALFRLDPTVPVEGTPKGFLRRHISIPYTHIRKPTGPTAFYPLADERLVILICIGRLSVTPYKPEQLKEVDLLSN